MPTYVTYTWKEKIDPALVKPVKAYVTYLSLLEKAPHDGLPSFPDEFVETITEHSKPQGLSLEGGYEEFFQHAQKAGLTSKTATNNILRLLEVIEDTEATLKLCPRFIRKLPEEESRKFYTDKLKVFAETKEFKEDEILSNEASLEYCSVVYSLFLRYVSLELEGDPIDKKSSDYLMRSSALATVFSSILSAYSQIANQQTLAELTSKFSKGDDKCLFKAITIDKSLLYNRAAKKRIVQAQLSGDKKFFSKLGKAISDDPLRRVGQYGKAYTVLNLYWLTGLYKLTAPELHNFLESCGLVLPSLEGGAFYKFLDRHIKPIYNF
jgi:hypothetical protein